ncbi:reverse transcriptase domain, reverse transcriptase zinc-binding domain protein [Tanacetum coccineum]
MLIIVIPIGVSFGIILVYIRRMFENFKECVDDIEVSDVNRAGLKFTWDQKSKGEDGLLKKIDRVMANLEFNGVLVVKSRVARNRIDMVFDSNGTCFEGSSVQQGFVNHYSLFLGKCGATTDLNEHDLFSNRLSPIQAEFIIRVVSNAEVKDTIFSMGDDKSLSSNGIVPPLNTDLEDLLVWRNRMGVDNRFSVGVAWDDIRPRGNIIVWLVLQRRLKKQDLLRQWDVSLSTELNLSRCSLCELVLESHNHLYFEYPFSSQVWS